MKNEYNQYRNSSHYFNEYTQVISSGANGKEKAVFSKKQLLILFDLLAEHKLLDTIDFSKVNKFDSIANLFHAISSKSKKSFIDQLRDIRNEELYSFKSTGELNQLIIMITNLADVLEKLTFRSTANAADKKLRSLEQQKNNMN